MLTTWLIQIKVAGEQYYCVAEMLLGLSQPFSSAFAFGLIGREANHHAVETSALMVCGLAFTNNDISARVNAFGPLTFCELIRPSSHDISTDLLGGRYLTEVRHRSGLIAMLRNFSIPTGWPVDPIIEDLEMHWSTTERMVS